MPVLFVTPEDWSRFVNLLSQVAKSVTAIQSNQAVMQAQLTALLNAQGLEAQQMADALVSLDNLTNVVGNIETAIDNAVAAIKAGGDPAKVAELQAKVDSLTARLQAAVDKLAGAGSTEPPADAPQVNPL